MSRTSVLSRFRLASHWEDVVARQALGVRPVADAHAHLGGDQHVALAPAAERLADDLLGEALRVGIRGVEQVDAGIDAEIDEAGRLGELRRAGGREGAAAAEGHRAHGDGGDLDAGASEIAVFHGHSPLTDGFSDQLGRAGSSAAAATISQPRIINEPPVGAAMANRRWPT